MASFADRLSAELIREPGRPLVTWYDERTGERIELSVTTYANWVAKAASLLVDEYDLERGDVLMVDLPVHWLTHVFWGAAWTAGLAVATPDASGSDHGTDAVVCGPDALARWTPLAAEVPVLACSLLPMGGRFTDPLPPGIHDVGIEIWGQPDAFIPLDPAAGSDVALVSGSITQDELFTSPTAAGSSAISTGGGRLLWAADPASPPDVPALARPLVNGGSLVVVCGADSARLEAIAHSERVTARIG